MSEVYTEEDLNLLLDKEMGTIQPWIAIKIFKKKYAGLYICKNF